jgi:cell division septum initiation protein DivIVA
MTDKEFKRLNRSQLIEIIYQFQLQVEELTARNTELENELADRRLRLSNVGNIAEAALEINDCFRSAQNAAEQYLEEVKAIRDEAEAQRQQILKDARKEASAIISEAAEIRGNYSSAVENIIKEIGKDHSDNG